MNQRQNVANILPPPELQPLRPGNLQKQAEVVVGALAISVDVDYQPPLVPERVGSQVGVLGFF